MIMVLAYRHNLKSLHLATDNHGAPVAITAEIGEDRREVGLSQEHQMAAKKKVATRPGGVIATIVEVISKGRGGTINEIVEALSKKFPERNPDSMRKTALIQANRNATSKDKTDEKRGLVYYKRR
jgi:hypothetical protein